MALRHRTFLRLHISQSTNHLHFRLRGPHKQQDKIKLENVAINYVLPLKATRRNSTANVKWFLGPQDTSDLISMVSFTFAMRRHLFGSHQRHLPPSVLQSLIGFRMLISVCGAWQRSSKQNLRRLLENPGPILTRLWTKVHKILE